MHKKKGKKTLINQLENGVCAYWALFNYGSIFIKETLINQLENGVCAYWAGPCSNYGSIFIKE